MSKDLLSRKWQDILWSTLLTILGIACFPANPLVLTGFIEVQSYLVLFIIGWVVWAVGMVLVMAPPLVLSYLQVSTETRAFWLVMIWMLGAMFLWWVYHEYQLRQRQKLLDSEPRWEILEVSGGV